MDFAQKTDKEPLCIKYCIMKEPSSCGKFSQHIILPSGYQENKLFFFALFLRVKVVQN